MRNSSTSTARGTSPSPIGSTSGTYHGSFMFSVDSGDTYPVVNRGDLVYASSPTQSPDRRTTRRHRQHRVSVADDGRTATISVGAEATAADVVAALTPTPSPSIGYGMAAIYHDFSRARDEQIAQALRSYSQPPTGPTFDDVFRADITQPTATFSNSFESTPLTPENLQRTIEQIQRSPIFRPRTIVAARRSRRRRG